jgi:hypothetical protein
MFESTYAPMLKSVSEDMAEVRRRILSGAMSAEDGVAVAKAGHTEVKSCEVDLHARVFAAKIHKVGDLRTLNDNDVKALEASAA